METQMLQITVQTFQTGHYVCRNMRYKILIITLMVICFSTLVTATSSCSSGTTIDGNEFCNLWTNNFRTITTANNINVSPSSGTETDISYRDGAVVFSR